MSDANFDAMTTADDGAERFVRNNYRRPGEGRRNDMRDIITHNLIEECDVDDIMLMDEVNVDLDWRTILDEVNGELSIDDIMADAGLDKDVVGNDIESTDD